jgi:hypothetical protein
VNLLLHLISGLANICEASCQRFFYKFQKILPRAHGNFEEQNKVLERSKIIINYSIIIINVYYNYIINEN